MELIYNDGGRKAAGYEGSAGDCVTRAIAIVTGKPYQEVYDALNALAKKERRGKRKKTISSARNGVYGRTARKYLESIGYEWTPTMKIGQGCKVHLCKEELPAGKLVISLSKHWVAVIDGVIHDTASNDAQHLTRGGTRCVYGYFKKDE